jgi:hypothetical protein
MKCLAIQPHGSGATGLVLSRSSLANLKLVGALPGFAEHDSMPETPACYMVPVTLITSDASHHE